MRIHSRSIPSPAAALDAAAAFWTPRSVAALVAGRWLVEPGDLDRPLTGVSIDSRTLEAGQVFLAIRGPHFDGHDFVTPAFASGAAIAIVEQSIDTRDVTRDVRLNDHSPGVLRVGDAVAALHRLAGAWRDLLAAAGCQVIAVAGSNGKTTTRHLIHSVLQDSEAALPESGTRVLVGTQSPRSFNNHLGVPLTLLAARAEHDFVVTEIGTNHPGEVDQLAAIARPDVAVITNVGREHLEHFGSLEAVAREEGALLAHAAPDGLAVVEAAAWRRIVEHYNVPPNLRVVRFGADADADVKLIDLHETAEGLRFGIAAPHIPPPASHIALPLLGRHNATNALAAVVVAEAMGVAMERVKHRLEQVGAVPGRLEMRRIGASDETGVLVLHDAYNANPDSMQAAIETLVGLDQPGRRKIAILGDMFELGTHGPDAHRQLGEHIAAHGDGIDQVVLVGRLTMFTAEALGRRWPQERVHAAGPFDETAAQVIAAMLAPGDIVLLKASRGVGLERLLPAIEQRIAK